MTKEQAQQELENLQKATTRFYASRAGKAQLDWLNQFEQNLLAAAITESDATKRISLLDQAKGVRAFHAYLETMIVRD